MESKQVPSVVGYLDHAYDISENREPAFRYLICSSPRVGSTWFADLLTQSHCAGAPAEYLNPKVLKWGAQSQGPQNFNIWSFLSDVEKRRTSPNGVFGVKVHLAETLSAIPERARETFTSRFLAHFDRVIFIKRRDKIYQAISAYRAFRQQTFNVRSEAEREAFKQRAREMPVCPYELTQSLAMVVRQEKAWANALKKNKTEHTIIYYEDLLGTTLEEMARIFEYIGVESSLDIFQDSYLILRDEETDNIYQNYISFLRQSESSNM